MNSGMASSLRARACCLALLGFLPGLLGLPCCRRVCPGSGNRTERGTERGIPGILDRSAYPDPVTAGVLGPVQPQVGRGEQFEQVTAVAAEDRDADRDRDADLRIAGADLPHAGTGPQPF